MKNILLMGSSEKDSNILKVSGVKTDSELICFYDGCKWTVIANILELPNINKNCIKVDSREIYKKMEQGCVKRSFYNLVLFFLKERGVKECYFDFNSSYLYLNEISKHIKVLELAGDYLSRMIKSEYEINELKKVQKLTGGAMGVAKKLLSEAIIVNGRLNLSGEFLTSEIVKGEINSYLAKNGAISSNTIVSSGLQTSEPHNKGSGFIFADSPIIIDIFPRLDSTGYWGDMTRSFCKGVPPKWLERMYGVVYESQLAGLEFISEGVSAGELDSICRGVISKSGYKTELTDNGWSGFFHSTGHGVGLDIHEGPGIYSGGDYILKAGDVVTVEPGIYIPKLGGVRIEDTVLVSENGFIPFSIPEKVQVID